MLNQAIITAARTYGALRTKAGRYPLKHGAVIVVQTAHQALVHGIGNASRFKQLAQAREVFARFFIQVVTQRRRIVQQCLNIRVFGIQNAQRVAVHATFAVFVQLLFMLFQERHQRIAVVSASFQRTDRVQLKGNVIGDTEGAPPAGGQHNQFGVNVRALQTKDFHTQLIKLPITTFLRTFVAEHRADIPQALLLIVQKTMFDAGAYAARRPFRTQSQAVAVAVLKGVHLFFNHIGHFADRAFE